jgi:beta-aspartyl-peptidase (threonine type)
MDINSAEGGSLKGAVPVVAIHGGCGTAALDQKSPRQWEEIRRALAQSLRAAWAILRNDGDAIDAVEAAVVVMEDSPYFNAGHGAALTAASEHELDAAIMDGASLAAGAVCSVRHIRNPVRAARAVMEHSDCVLICGDAADRFAQSRGLNVVDNGYFTTPERIAALASLKARAASGTIGMATEAERHGTVGAVALDVRGHLAAATSTGGFNGKTSGRIGDSPIIGAGTYAADGVCAVSCTGQGEIFIRRVAAYDIAARIAYAGQSLQTACDEVINSVLSAYKVGAGLVAIDAAGNVQAPFNTLGMARGWIGRDGTMTVATHGESFQLKVS